MKPRADIDLARSLKTIEGLKTDMLTHVTDLYRSMREGHEEAIVDHLANITVVAYVLGRRLGIDFSQMDAAIRNKVLANVTAAHELEEWYGDFSALGQYLDLD